MPSTASKQLSGGASLPVTRTRSRCGTGPVAASATTAGAVGGPTTATSSPPPLSDRTLLGQQTHAGVPRTGVPYLPGWGVMHASGWFGESASEAKKKLVIAVVGEPAQRPALGVVTAAGQGHEANREPCHGRVEARASEGRDDVVDV